MMMMILMQNSYFWIYLYYPYRSILAIPFFIRKNYHCTIAWFFLLYSVSVGNAKVNKNSCVMSTNKNATNISIFQFDSDFFGVLQNLFDYFPLWLFTHFSGIYHGTSVIQNAMQWNWNVSIGLSTYFGGMRLHQISVCFNFQFKNFCSIWNQFIHCRSILLSHFLFSLWIETLSELNKLMIARVL